MKLVSIFNLFLSCSSMISKKDITIQSSEAILDVIQELFIKDKIKFETIIYGKL